MKSYSFVKSKEREQRTLHPDIGSSLNETGICSHHNQK